MILCPSCGLENVDTASFCSHCGTAISLQGKTIQVGTTNKPVDEQPAPARRSAPPVDTADERTLWEGYPSFRTAIPVLAIEVLLFIVAFVGVAVATGENTATGSITPQVIVFVLFAVVLLGTLARYYIRLRSTKYKLTNQRIFITEGIFSKRIDEIELEKYRDIFVNQPFLNRLMGCGDVKVVTGDVTNATVDIVDVADPMEKKEMIRSAARERQKAIGIVRREDL